MQLAQGLGCLVFGLKNIPPAINRALLVSHGIREFHHPSCRVIAHWSLTKGNEVTGEATVDYVSVRHDAPAADEWSPGE